MIDLGLAGRVALVAGGSKGIGKGVALAFARQGVDVAICARGKQELENAAREISAATGRRILPIQADLARLEDVQRFVATSVASLGRIDILVYSANPFGGGTFAEISDENWCYHLDAKLLGCIRCCREVISHMKKNHWGRIVIMAGGAAHTIRPNSVDNGPICAGLANFGKQIANEVAPYGILVNTIHPSRTRTARMEGRIASIAHEEGITIEEAVKQDLKLTPIGRFMEPEDFANLALFLCSQLATAITGQSISVDGGRGTAITY